MRTTAPAHLRARSPASHCGRQSSERHVPPQANYKQDSQHYTIASGTHRERAISASAKSQSSHCSAARATLRTASRQGFRPEALHNHLNNCTCIHKLAVPCMEFMRGSHNRAVQPMRARQHESIALRQEKGRQCSSPREYIKQICQSMIELKLH